MTARVVDTRQKAVRQGQTLTLLLLLAASSWANSSTNLKDADTDLQVGSLSVSYAENSALRIVSWHELFPEEPCPSTETESQWELVGPDSYLFELDACALRFRVGSQPPSYHRFLPDFEVPQDSNQDNDYEVTVKHVVEPSSYRSVLVRITDVNEAGKLLISDSYPKRDQVIQARLEEPDGDPAEVIWEWERSIGPEQFSPISGANNSQYTPTAGDTGRFLRVKARYSDEWNHSKPSATEATEVEVSVTLSSVVLGPTLLTLSGFSEDYRQRTLHPNFDPEVLHYAIPCAERDVLHLAWMAPTEVRVDVNGIQSHPGPQSQVARSVIETSDVVVRLADASGAVTRYTVHCVPLELYGYHTTGNLDNQLLSFTENSWGVLMDEHGVPRWHREGTSGFFFKSFVVYGERVWIHGDTVEIDASDQLSMYAASIEPTNELTPERNDQQSIETEPAVSSPTNDQQSPTESTTRFVWTVLDSHFESFHTYSTVKPLSVTGRHDFRLLQTGEAMLMAYQPATRDFSFLSKDQQEINSRSLESPESMAHTLTSSIRFNDPQGQPWSDSVETQDSVIQIVDSAGRAKWTWNSWGRVPLEDCTQGRFTGDYAHINSIEMTDHGIVASLRGCSTILMLDPQAPLGEEVVWRIGESNLEQDEWEVKGLGPAPLKVVGDHLGGFCGQHAATLSPNTSESRLTMFDNGVLCLEDPTTQEPLGRKGDEYSRVVEYAIDQRHGEAVFIREYSLAGHSGSFARSRGHIEVQEDGNWLVSWSGALGTSDQSGSTELGVSISARPPAQVSLVNPALVAEQFALLRSGSRPGSVTALAVPKEIFADSITSLTVVSIEETSKDPTEHSRFFIESDGTSTDQIDHLYTVVFSSPVVSFESNTPSIDQCVGDLMKVTPLQEFGKSANSFQLGFQSETDCETEVFQFSYDQDCSNGGICTADGRRLVSSPTSYSSSERRDL